MANCVRRQPSEIRDDEFTRRVRGCEIKVRKTLRVGLLENAYETCFALELTKNGFSVARQVPLPIDYDGEKVDLAYVPLMSGVKTHGMESPRPGGSSGPSP